LFLVRLTEIAIAQILEDFHGTERLVDAREQVLVNVDELQALELTDVRHVAFEPVCVCAQGLQVGRRGQVRGDRAGQLVLVDHKKLEVLQKA
jgi:hypothetical protein